MTIEASAVPTRMAIIPVVPGSYANKYPIHKIIRAVEAVRRAGVGVIIIVAIGANRRRAIIAGAHPHADEHSLCARKGSAKEANP